MKVLMDTEYDAFRTALEKDPQVSIRVNSRKLDSTELSDIVPWCEKGRSKAK